MQDRDAPHVLDLDAHFSFSRSGWTLALPALIPPPFFLPAASLPRTVGTVGRKGVQVEPRRWKIEQTFGCLQRYCRLRIDDQASLETSRHMTMLVAVFMTDMRLQRRLHS